MAGATLVGRVVGILFSKSDVIKEDTNETTFLVGVATLLVDRAGLVVVGVVNWMATGIERLIAMSDTDLILVGVVDSDVTKLKVGVVDMSDTDFTLVGVVSLIFEGVTDLDGTGLLLSRDCTEVGVVSLGGGGVTG